MYPVLEARASEILERYPARSLPLSRLHEILVAEIGPAAGTYHDLQASLRQSTARFLVMEPRDPLPAAQDWPAEIRSAYVEELGRLPGSETMVALTRPSVAGEGDPLSALHQTLCDLRDSGLSVTELFRELTQLHEQLAQAERSTTLPQLRPPQP